MLDMTDEAFPFGVNLFIANQINNAISLAQSIDKVMHVFETLWPETESQQYFNRYLRAAIIVLFANPGSTLVDMYQLLTNDHYRQKMLKNVTDQTVQTFWRVQYDELANSARMQRVGALVGRLESLFMGRSLVRNIVGQSQNTIDFRKAIENKEIIFIKLPIKLLAADARLIGTMLVAQIHAAIFSFADMPDSKRPGFSLYVDEVQHFATPDFAEMFTEGRKFGVRVTIAHQYRNQLPSFLQDSTMTARTKVVFQPTPEDSRELSHLFPGGEATVRPEDMDKNVVEQLQYLTEISAIGAFIDGYVLDMLMHKKSGTVEITNPGDAGFLQMPGYGARVPEPLQFVNRLLYDVMRNSDPYQPIPEEIVYGFSNAGRGFFCAFRDSYRKELLSANIKYPPALVVETAEGKMFTRAPENSKEQLYHFLFCFRTVMEYLALYPIGKKSTTSTSEVAHMLTQLPRRAAFVRSGNEVGVIYTHDTDDPVTSEEFKKRMKEIKAQTRAKYCKPKDQVEAHNLPKPEDHSHQDTETVHHTALRGSRWEVTE